MSDVSRLKRASEMDVAQRISKTKRQKDNRTKRQKGKKAKGQKEKKNSDHINISRRGGGQQVGSLVVVVPQGL